MMDSAAKSDRADKTGKHEANRTTNAPSAHEHEFEPVATPLRLFNTLSRSVERIVPLEAGRIRMYSCGPTVYRFIHVGNLRTFTMADWIRRALTEQSVAVTHVKNITDVGHMRQEALDRGEDKLVAQARQEGKTPWDIAAFYTEAFHNDERKLNILPAHVFPRATDHIAEMIAMTRRLLENGCAYESGGNVFFSVKDFPSYGRLSGNLLEYLGQGQHAANEIDTNKRAPEDFPLWKVAEEGRIMAWDSPWGRGFPGWHIECSAMSAKYLGPQFDLHTGGVDNIFPHHEDERAQSEAASGQPFVSYWVHGQHLLADGLKMAKSTGNAYTLADVEARGFEPLALRYFFTMAKYRSRINFTFRALRAAQISLTRLRELTYRLSLQPSQPTVGAGFRVADAASRSERHPPERRLRPQRSLLSSKGRTSVLGEEAGLLPAAEAAHHAFFDAVNDDLNMPRSLAVVWRTARDESLTPAQRLNLLYAFDRVLGFDLAASVERRSARERQWRTSDNPILALEDDIPADVLALARERLLLRQHGHFPEADALRARIHAAGYEARDTTQGTLLVRRAGDEALISGSADAPSQLDAPDRHAFSVALLAHNSRDDLARCVESVARHSDGRDIEIVILDNGSTDDTLAYLKRLDASGAIDGLPVRILFADHDMGFAAGRNAEFRVALGRIVVQIDTSIELVGDIWTPIEALLARPDIGLVGPYGLVTDDLREFREDAGPNVDAIEGYLMAFRRASLREVGPADEKFRFYRLMDIDYSFEFKKAGFRVVASPEIAARVVKHPHREWYSLTEEEQATKSKKNYDIFRRRRHHCESLLVRNYVNGQPAPWGHDHEVAPELVDPRFEHAAHAGAEPHSHEHKHWGDHSHTHPHVHRPTPRWLDPATPATYQPSLAESDSLPSDSARPHGEA